MAREPSVSPAPAPAPTRLPDERRAAVEALFDAAVDLAPAARAALLDARCADRPTLRREVDVLLAYAEMATTDSGRLGEPSPVWSLRTAALLADATPRFESPEWMRPGAAVEHYELIRQLGSGGMSTVFLARDTQLGRRVAMKFLHRSGQGFESEARVTARCEHPNIVRIYAVGAFRGCPFIVLEHVAGQMLRSVLAGREVGPDAAVVGAGGRARDGLPTRQVAEIMLPVARALEAAHRQGVVHCDLKPENILIDHDGTPKVLDFGIARLLGDGLAPGAVVGTPPYMSPEQLRGEPLDHRTDLWSAGVMLFEMLTGRLPFTDLGQQLDAAFERSGCPAAVADAAPALALLHPLVEACLQGDPNRRPATAGALAEGLGALLRGHDRPIDEAHVFAGLAPFQASDAGRFFGREAEIETVVGRLRREPRLLVIGPSGVGKSSLLRAGVGPALEREGWQVLTVRPGGDPLGALARALDEVERSPDQRPTGPELAAEPGRFGLVLRQAARARRAPSLVIVDQLEELYTRGLHAATRRIYLACLRGAADDPSAPVRIVSTLRADFLHHVLADEHHQADPLGGVVSLGPPDREGLRAALVGPVEAVGYRFDHPELVDELLDGLEACATPLPLLQFAARRLWSARDRTRRVVTRADIVATGGIEGALAEHADGVVAGLPPPQQAVTRRVCVRLVTPDRTRNRVSMSELHGLDPNPERVEQVVAALVHARLLTVEAEGGQRWVELVHESLIERWPWLRRWLSEVDQDAAFEARLRGAAAQWSRAGGSEGLLWRGGDAREAGRWARRHRDPADSARLGSDGASFLDAVVRAAERRRWQRRITLGGALLALLFATLIFAHLRGQAADEAIRAANWARISVARNLDDDPTMMLAVLREVEGEPPPSWSRLVRWALERNPARSVLSHPGLVSSAIWSPDGRHIATACGDEAIRIWRPDAFEPERTIPAHQINRLRFAPSGRRVVSASKDGTARVWSLDGDTPPTMLEHPANLDSESLDAEGQRHLKKVPGSVYHAVFDAEERRVATASFDGQARIWALDGTTPITLDHGSLPDGDANKVYGVAFTAGGAQLATVAWDGRLRLWSTESGALLATIEAHDSKPAPTVDIAPDGRIATGGYDNHIRIWTPDGSAQVFDAALPAAVNAVGFGPSGRHIAAGDVDGGVWFSAVDGGEPVQVGRHGEQVLSVDVSPDGETIISASIDGSARLWSISDLPPRRVLRRHSGPVTAVAISPDGQTLVSTGIDGTVSIGPLDGSRASRVAYTGQNRLGTPTLTLGPRGETFAVADSARGIVRARLDGAGRPTLTPRSGSWLTGLAFSADGSLAGTDYGGRVWVWPPGSGGSPALIGRHRDRALAVAADPRGRYIATGSSDLSVRLWPLRPEVEAALLGGHPGAVETVAFSPDGAALVAGTLGGAWLWSLDSDPRRRRVLIEGTQVEAVTFAPDGRTVVTAAVDHTLRLWPVDGGEPVVIHGDSPFTAVAFTPDGRALVAGSRDGAVRVYRNLAPLDASTLWDMTYCLSAAKRESLLGVSAAEARDGHRRCQSRVRAALAHTPR